MNLFAILDRSARAASSPAPPSAGQNRADVTCLNWQLTYAALIIVAFATSALGAATNAPLEWHQAAGHRWSELEVPTEGKIGFKRLNGLDTGILFTNSISDERSLTNRNLLSGSGVALGDVDGDGLCDIFFCRLGGPNKLYRNLGNWKFQDITEEAGVACGNQDYTAAVFADIDGDGDLDLLVNSLGGGTRVFENDGHGHFKEITVTSGVGSTAGSMSMALADVDGNGTLDLYVANYRPTTIRDQPKTRVHVEMVNGAPTVTRVNDQPTTRSEWTNRFGVTASGEVLEFGEPPMLYLNDGTGHFSAASWTDGTFLDEDGHPLTEPPRDWGLAVQFHDLNGDGAPDIYTCNDLFSPDRIWINDGKGKFHAIARAAIRNTSTFSMGVDFADIDRDGAVDFFVVDMLSREHQKRHVQVSPSPPIAWPIGVIENRPQVMRNTLQLNRGDGTFAEISYYAGVEASEWSWGPIFLDVDLDGYEDILVTNGQLRDFQNIDLARRLAATRASGGLSESALLALFNEYPGLLTSKLIFRNRGDRTFEEVGAAWGFDSRGISQGMALADLDNDGDLDVVMNNLNEQAGIYRNEGIAPRVAVRLQGKPPNTQGIGARIKVLGGPVPQSQEVICGGRYLSGDDPMRVFAAGTLTNHLSIEVTWRNGKRSVVSDARANRIYEIAEAGATDASNSGPAAAPPAISPIFEDVSGLLHHRHVEEPFDDFARQPLLPNRLSQLGPGVCWFDLDGDSWDDLIIATGKGGKPGLFRNNGHGGFVPMSSRQLGQIATRDQTTILGAASSLIIGYSNYEDGLTNGVSVEGFDLTRPGASVSLPDQLSSAGPLALADIDDDGDLDLFVGGRVIPGKYPAAASSRLYRNESGKFVLDEENSRRLERVGLVSGAVFSDLDGDGFPELILACEWGPLRVFHNDHGKFTEVTQQLGLANLTGWWNGVTTGDLDGDGKMDIIASNWGLNSKYRTNRQHPRRLYFADLDGNGTVDLIESYYDEGMAKEAPERSLLAAATGMPFLRGRIPDFATYAQAGLADIYGDALKSAGVVDMNTLTSMAFLNRGDHFEGTNLPPEAQFAPAFGVCVGDFDGDGHEDVFLSQNFFATSPDTARTDAGRGLWLRGDGRGGFRAVPGQESGVTIYGEQRGCALADYDGDGRIDLVVSQNGNATKLYHNLGAKPGLRVRLNAGANNPTGVGAVARLVFGKNYGPAREVHAGAGYWSQDSAVQVMATPQSPTLIWVRWPGGRITQSDLPPGAREIEVNAAGNVRLIR